MESQQPRKDNPCDDDQQEKSIIPSGGHLSHLSTIDTSRPFRSVKEAVEIFGERFLTRDVYSSTSTPKPPLTINPKEEDILVSTNIAPPKPFSPLLSSSSSSSFSTPKLEQVDDFVTKNVLKKLEMELEETKHELKLLKERESEMEIVVASLKAELHKNMSKMAESEAKTAGEKAAAASKATKSTAIVKEEDDQESMYLKSLAEVLRLGENEGYFGKKKKKKNRTQEKMNMKKEKPIIPLVGDLISWKIKSSS